jgi:hypothetical protein
MQALQKAARVCDREGWAQVEDAVRWVNAHYPNERPKNYGCKSWPALMKKSQLFDLRSVGSDPVRKASFRLRPQNQATFCPPPMNVTTSFGLQSRTDAPSAGRRWALFPTMRDSRRVTMDLILSAAAQVGLLHYRTARGTKKQETPQHIHVAGFSLV